MGIFKSAKLMIAFYRDRDGKKLEKPFVWEGKKPGVSIAKKDLSEQESFLLVEGEEGSRDVEVRLHPEKIILTRDPGDFWTGIVLDEGSIKIAVGGRMVEVAPDGAVKVRDDKQPGVVGSIEADGAVYRLASDGQIFVSADGGCVSVETEERLSRLTPDGVVSMPVARKGAAED